jgi:hypothetical protein
MTRKLWKSLASHAPTLQKKNIAPVAGSDSIYDREPIPGKKPLPKPEQFVDLSIVEQLEKSGFLDALNK